MSLGSRLHSTRLLLLLPHSLIYSPVYESAYDVTDKRLNCATRIQFVRLLSTVFIAKERLFSLFILFFSCSLSVLFRQNVLWSSENCQVSENEMLSQPIAWFTRPPAISSLFMLGSHSHAEHFARERSERARERERERANKYGFTCTNLFMTNVFLYLLQRFHRFRSFHSFILFRCFAGSSPFLYLAHSLGCGFQHLNEKYLLCVLFGFVPLFFSLCLFFFCAIIILNIPPI